MYSEYKGGLQPPSFRSSTTATTGAAPQNKPQKAGYEAETAGWDTDPDSNASDEEDLKQ